MRRRAKSAVSARTTLPCSALHRTALHCTGHDCRCALHSTGLTAWLAGCLAGPSYHGNDMCSVQGDGSQMMPTTTQSDLSGLRASENSARF